MMDELAPALRRLPEPAAPPAITATVMARIAREEEARLQTAASPAARRDRPAWVWALFGAAVVLGIRLYPWVVAGIAPDVTTARIGLGHLPGMPSPDLTTTTMVTALLIYLAGLFAPLRRRGVATRR